MILSGNEARECDKLRPLSQRPRNRRRRPSVPRTTSIAEPALFGYLADCESILVAGAGGGFDIYAGLPLAHALWRRGQIVHLANLSFTNLVLSDAEKLGPSLYKVAPDTAGPDEYFPERALARFLETEQLPSTVYAFPRLGVRQLLVAYQALVTLLELDAIVLVDGGTDLLMFGDESGLGTPVEDMASLAAVGQLRIAHRRRARCICEQSRTRSTRTTVTPASSTAASQPRWTASSATSSSRTAPPRRSCTSTR